MMGDFKPSASASAEANAVKVQGNTINFNRAPEGAGWIERTARLIAPVAYERREAAARDVRVDSLIANAKKMRDAFPGWSERRAVMEAAGYRMTNGQAENVTAALGGAQEIIAESEKEVPGLSPEALDCIVDSSRKAYDDCVREMWSKLTAGEAENPGSYSRKTMAILADMDREDARNLMAFCSMCAGGRDQFGIVQPTIPCLFLDEGGTSYNGGAISYAAVQSLASLGLVNLPASTWFGESSNPILCIGGTSRRLTGYRGRVSVGDATLTRYGEELSRLCEIGTDTGLLECCREHLETDGARLLVQGSAAAMRDPDTGAANLMVPMAAEDIVAMFND